MRGLRRISATLLTVAVMLVLAASPVWAVVSKSGYLACAINKTQWTNSLSTGTTDHRPGPSGFHRFENGGSMIHREWAADAPAGGSWRVDVTNGQLDDAGTYAVCKFGTF